MGKNGADCNLHNLVSKNAIQQAGILSSSEDSDFIQHTSGLNFEHEQTSELNQAKELCRSLADEIIGIESSIGAVKVGKKWTASDSGCKGNGATYHKLEELLNSLRGKATGDQAKLLQRLQEEVEIDKSYFLCHWLKVHGQLVEERREELEGQEDNLTKTKSKDFLKDDLRELLVKAAPFVAHGAFPLSTQTGPKQRIEQDFENSSECKTIPDCISSVSEDTTRRDLYGTNVDEISPDTYLDLQSYNSHVGNVTPSRCSEDDMEDGVSSSCL